MQHTNHACELMSCDEIDKDLGTSSGPELRARGHISGNSQGNAVAEMILAKKSTRKHTYYQVYCL